MGIYKVHLWKRDIYSKTKSLTRALTIPLSIRHQHYNKAPPKHLTLLWVFFFLSVIPLLRFSPSFCLRDSSIRNWCAVSTRTQRQTAMESLPNVLPLSTHNVSLFLSVYPIESFHFLTGSLEIAIIRTKTAIKTCHEPFHVLSKTTQIILSRVWLQHLKYN